ncbi:putative transcription factor WD40-like family [Helianthus debilis subsp. tardiflorus]
MESTLLLVILMETCIFSTYTHLIIHAYRCGSLKFDSRFSSVFSARNNTCLQDVHVGEVLSLNFSVPVKKCINSVEDSESYYFLASSGRDKTIHLFDVNRNFHPIARIDDHSAAVSSVKLTGNGRKIISCGSDRSLIFHEVAGSDKDYNISDPHQQKASHGTIYDIAIDPTTETAVTVGQASGFKIVPVHQI